MNGEASRSSNHLMVAERAERALGSMAARMLAPSGRNGRLLILVYHRVHAQPDPMLPHEPTAERFDRQLELLSREFQVLPLLDAVERLEAGCLPGRAVSLTFDDGYADNFEVAKPILEKYGLKATFFVAAGFLGGGIMWNDKVRESLRKAPTGELDLNRLGLGVYQIDTLGSRLSAAQTIIKKIKYLDQQAREDAALAVAEETGVTVANALMMLPEQVRKLAESGMDIGAHTVTHPVLSALSPKEVHREISEGRDALEAMTGQKVEAFAYPNGRPGDDYTREHVEILRRQGFRLAVSTARGYASHGSDRFQLPRIGLRGANHRVMRRSLIGAYLHRAVTV
jgi:peptidoglycan/xylan/chitin deacetylase (PgdA/CDA1 family)